jgi:1-acyl-sn-glycerol-3-phosphate acyltransferase
MRKHIYFLTPIILQPVLYIPTLILFKLCCNLEIKGREHLKGLKGRVIIASNHASEWDPILIRTAFPFFSRFAPLYYVSAPKENFKTFGWKYFIYGGFFFEIMGAYSIRPGKHDYAYSLNGHIQILERNQTLCIFPEGKRVAPDEPRQAHGGVAFLSHTTQAPVLPIHIENTYKITAKEFFFSRRKVTLTFRKPFTPQEVVPSSNPTVDDFKQGGEKVLGRVYQN